MENIPRLNHTPVGWLIEALLSAGLSRRTIEEMLSAEHRQAGSADFMVPAEDFARFFESVAEAAGDPILGLHIGENTKISDFSILGYLLENTPTVADWFESLQKYHHAFARDAKIAISAGADGLDLHYHLNVPSYVHSRQDTLMVMAAIVAAMRRHLGADWVPKKCRLAFDTSENLEEIRRVLGPDTRFGQDTNAISLAGADLHRSIKGADPALLGILKQQADSIIAAFGHEDDLIHRVKLILASNAANEQFTMDEAASMLNMSVRKLHRRLAGFSTTYREIRDDVITLLAREKLRDPKLSITQIAHQLGYSETSAFTRAFTRLCGTSPTEFRAKNALNEFSGEDAVRRTRTSL